MTWWDHATQSIWSQPVGEAIAGPLRGESLELLPSQVTTWGNWVKSFPKSFVMINDLDRLGSFRQGFDPDFVIGVVVEDQAKAYYYEDVAEKGFITDMLGDLPVLVWAADGDFRVYLRKVGDDILDFHLESDVLTDTETGSTWDVTLGLATGGPLKGESLQHLPSLTSFDWAWRDFYPDTEFFDR
jgi:hypothetical protein